jgi:heme-degrading monooxygenase HmoA
MEQLKKGSVAVIFVSRKTDADAEDYGRAAAEMEEAVRAAPGYIGHDSVSSPEGSGITVSYWESQEAAAAWRAHARHSQVREEGRKSWYSFYRLVVADVARAYNWHK